MQFKKVENRYIIRFTKGEEIISTLTRFLKKEEVNTGFFYGLGAVLSAKLAFYNLENKEYEKKNFTTPHEILNITGNVSLVDKMPFIHAHITLSNAQFTCVGGHVMKATVGATCEVYLYPEEVQIERIYDTEIGLKLLHCTSS